MKKVIFGIFAHPDDEAFGPAGTLLMETKAGTELHLITLTLGDAGMNPDNHQNLSEIREQEWHAGGALMGATSMHFLGFKDGHLSNQSMIEAGEQIVQLVKNTVSERKDIEIEFMTIDLNGISGHIDHIVAARAAAWAFYTLKDRLPMSRIRFACLTRDTIPTSNIHWLYMEAGHPAEEIDETIDARQYRDEIIKIMRCHHSQRSDGELHIKNRGDQLGIDHFIVKN